MLCPSGERTSYGFQMSLSHSWCVFWVVHIHSTSDLNNCNLRPAFSRARCLSGLGSSASVDGDALLHRYKWEILHTAPESREHCSTLSTVVEERHVNYRDHVCGIPGVLALIPVCADQSIFSYY